MIDSLHIGYSKIIYNTLKSYDKIEKQDMACRFGYKKTNEIIRYALDGKQLELAQREKNLKSYYDVVINNGIEDFVNKTKFVDAVQSYRNKAGYGSHFDFVTHENYIGFENEETKFLDSFMRSVNMMECKQYTEEEKKKADRVIAKIRKDRVEKNKQAYFKRIAKKKKNIFSLFKSISKVKLPDAPIE